MGKTGFICFSSDLSIVGLFANGKVTLHETSGCSSSIKKVEQRVFYWAAAETGLCSGELGGVKLDDIEDEKFSVSR
jgi:hypothetical protein